MKVVILAGGLGTRISEETATRPKPMIEIGERPDSVAHHEDVLGHHGFNEFVICCGYKGYVHQGVLQQLLPAQLRRHVRHARRRHGSAPARRSSRGASRSWTPARTRRPAGACARCRDYVGDETFMLTYGDGVADVDITALVEFHRAHGRIGTVTAVQPAGRFGALGLGADADGRASSPRSPPATARGYRAATSCFEPGHLRLPRRATTASWSSEPLERLAADGRARGVQAPRLLAADGHAA